jgi:hypothetical protein
MEVGLLVCGVHSLICVECCKALSYVALGCSGVCAAPHNDSSHHPEGSCAVNTAGNRSRNMTTGLRMKAWRAWVSVGLSGGG